jgi:hypothetical protein
MKAMQSSTLAVSNFTKCSLPATSEGENAGGGATVGGEKGLLARRRRPVENDSREIRNGPAGLWQQLQAHAPPR